MPGRLLYRVQTVICKRTTYDSASFREALPFFPFAGPSDEEHPCGDDQTTDKEKKKKNPIYTSVESKRKTKCFFSFLRIIALGKPALVARGERRKGNERHCRVRRNVSVLVPGDLPVHMYIVRK